MDSTAITMCMDNRLPIIVFNLRKPGNIRRAVLGEAVGTSVESGPLAMKDDVIELARE